ncbi:MAG: hypothetical protein ACQEW8_12150 [Actinomycetota bacterium]
MAAGDIETFHQNGLWFNRIEGESRTLGAGFNSEEEALVAGRGAAVARQVQHTLRAEDGPSEDDPLERHPRDVIGGSAATH